VLESRGSLWSLHEFSFTNPFDSMVEQDNGLSSHFLHLLLAINAGMQAKSRTYCIIRRKCYDAVPVELCCLLSVNGLRLHHACVRALLCRQRHGAYVHNLAVVCKFLGTETVYQNRSSPHNQNLILWPSRYSDEIVTVSQNVLTVTKVQPFKDLTRTGVNPGVQWGGNARERRSHTLFTFYFQICLELF